MNRADNQKRVDELQLVQEYRKASAEKLGFKIIRVPVSVGRIDSYYYKGKKEICLVRNWKPDLKENANQREMIEDLLIEQGYELGYASISKTWGMDIEKDDILIAECVDKSKSIAFMNSFMEWQRKEEG